MVIISPSILAADFANLETEIKRVEEAGVEWLHFDVMDGRYVPNITIGAPVLKAVKAKTDLFLDVHLMIMEPHLHVEAFAKSGADLITFHLEPYNKDPELAYVKGYSNDLSVEATQVQDFDVDAIRACISKIKELGVKVGMSVNIATGVEALEPFVKDLDLVLLMSITPGFGGQKFMPVVYDKIAAIKKMAATHNRTIGDDVDKGDLVIEIDGGVIPGEVAQGLKEAGATALVAGTAIYKSEDIGATVQALR